MIIKVNEKEKPVIIEYCNKEPINNLFAIGDLQSFTLNDEFLQVFCEINNTHEKESDKKSRLVKIEQIKGLILRYYNNILPITYLDDYSFFNLIKHLKTSIVNIFNFSGKPFTIKLLLDSIGEIKDKEYRETNFCELTKLENLKNIRIDLKVKRLEKKQIDEYISLLKSTFTTIPPSKEAIQRTISSNAGRYYIVEYEGEIIGSAATGVETNNAAMIIAVMTSKNYRKQGIATRIMHDLCKDLLSEGKKPCLFYDNEEAGRIYKNIGFKDIGKYSLGKIKI